VRLVNFEVEGENHVGAVVKDELVVKVEKASSHNLGGLIDLINLGEKAIAEVKEIVRGFEDEIGNSEFLEKSRKEGKLYKLGEIELNAPIRRPPKLIYLGRNYAEHAKETGAEIPEEPIIFLKAPSSVIGHKDEILLYPDIAKRIDYEVELAVVIGKKCIRAKKEQAYDFIVGWTIFKDITARDIQSRDIKAGRPWARSKSFDTFGPMGPYLTLKDQVEDPQNLELELRVNGEVKQHSNTKYMIFPIADLIEYISQCITLEPGDVIATGTPSGIGAIKSGDVTEAEVEGLGILTNPVR